jgi:membrane protein YqaA with SNARE-associated domain
MFQKLYQWTLSLAESRHAPAALGAVSFAESSFFPIPPDIVLVPMAAARPERAWRYAGICTVASVLGGMLGYLIGAVFFDTVGQWIINLYGLQSKVGSLQETYAKWGWAVILIKGLTPIPFKLVTIVSGMMHYDFLLFVVFSAITRGARFYLLAGLMNRFGGPIKAFLDKHAGVALAVLLLIIVAGFWFVTKLL